MLRSVAELRESGDIQAIGDLIPYARTVGLKVRRDGGGLVTVLQLRETNIGNHTLHLIHDGVDGALLEHAAIMHLLLETEVSVVPKIINISVDFLSAARTRSRAATSSVKAGTLRMFAPKHGRTIRKNRWPPRTRISC